MLRFLASRINVTSVLDWSKVESVSAFYDDASRGAIVTEMVSKMGSPTIDHGVFRGWLNGSVEPDFRIRGKDPHSKGRGRGASRVRATSALKNAVAEMDRKAEAVALAQAALERAREDVSSATLIERAMTEYAVMAEVVETVKPVYSSGVGWAFLKCLAMRDKLVAKDPDKPDAKYDYDPFDETQGYHAYGYKEMFDRVEQEKLGDEIRVIQVVMHYARNDRLFQASVKQELFTICARRYAEAVAHYRELPVEHVHSVSPAIGDDEVLRVLSESMTELPSATDPSEADNAGHNSDPLLV